MSLDKSPISNKENSPPHFYPTSEATEAESKIESQEKVYIHSSQDTQDTVETFKEANASGNTETKVYDYPAQNPVLVPPATNVQERSAFSPVTETAAATMERAQEGAKTVFNNIKINLNGFEEAIDKIIEDLSRSQDPEAKKKVSFTRKIKEAIQALKAALQDMNIADAIYERMLTSEKFDQLEGREGRLEALIKKQEAAETERKKAETLRTVMKFLGPILSALATIIGAALAIFTFGASLALVLASVAIGVAFTTYSIVESATGAGLTNQVVQAFNEFVKELLPNSPEWVHTLVKVITVIVVVAILAVVAFAASGAVAANVAGKAATELAKTFAAEATKQLAMQLIPMTILASNALPELVANSMKAAGSSKEEQKTAEIIIMIIQVLAVILALVLTGKSGGGGKGVKAPQVSEKDIWKGVARSFAEAGRSGAKLAMASVQLVAAKRYGLGPEQLAAIIEKIQTASFNLLTIINKLIDLTNMGTQMVTNVILGISNLEQAKLLKEIGDIKGSEELIQEMIRLLERITNNLQSGITNRSEFINKINEAIKKFYEEISQNTTRLFRPVQG